MEHAQQLKNYSYDSRTTLQKSYVRSSLVIELQGSLLTLSCDTEFNEKEIVSECCAIHATAIRRRLHD